MVKNDVFIETRIGRSLSWSMSSRVPEQKIGLKK